MEQCRKIMDLRSKRITASFHICLALLLLFVATREICYQNARHWEVYINYFVVGEHVRLIKIKIVQANQP